MADAPPSFTVVDANGTAVGRTIALEGARPIVLLSVGGREVKLEVLPNGFGRVLEVSGFSEIFLYDKPDDVYYPDSLDCSGASYSNAFFPSTLLPIAYASAFTQYADPDTEGVPVGTNLYLVDPQTLARVLSAGAYLFVSFWRS